MSGDSRVTWGDPNPRRGDGGTAATFCTVAANDLDECETVQGTLSESLGEVDEPTVEGPLELDDVPPEVVADRYERRTPLGSGGMGEGWRVHDRLLRRTVALKVIRSKLVGERTVVRFRKEAQVSAQMQHPGIIPVHDYGQLDDGRVWFPMKEVRGRTLEELLTEVHRAWRLGHVVADWTRADEAVARRGGTVGLGPAGCSVACSTGENRLDTMRYPTTSFRVSIFF